MGEFALYEGERIKIGTAEDLLYLRAEQARLVTPLNYNPERALEVYSFRFPWPDEDRVRPGAFAVADRELSLPGLLPPTQLAGTHDSMQFSSGTGYTLRLPCPESGRLPDGLSVRRAGPASAVLLTQQRYHDGRLVAVLRCGGCGYAWRAERLQAATPAIDALRREADRREAERTGSGRWWAEVADRVQAGYELEATEFQGFREPT
jgi:hypothetical protein